MPSNSAQTHWLESSNFQRKAELAISDAVNRMAMEAL